MSVALEADVGPMGNPLRDGFSERRDDGDVGVLRESDAVHCD